VRIQIFMKMIQFTSLFLGLFMMSIQPSKAYEADSIRDITQRIQNGIHYHEEAVLRDALVSLDEYTQSEEWRAPAYYYKAYIHYRLATMFEEEIEEEQDELIEQAVTWLQEGLDDSKTVYKADMYALLSSCYGILIGGPFSAMSYGPKAQEAMNKAKSFGPENPRAYLLDGIGKMYTPAMFGGGERKAMKLFEKSLRYFEKEAAGSKPLISWGNAEIYVWIGQLYEQQDQWVEARESYQKALSRNPDFKWVNEKLLPDVNAKLDS
jgi:tetratricopeptide (TPR) repeat protein